MVTVFPIAYFGNIEYFRELVEAKNPVLEIKENFVKQTLRTRCEILTANGLLQLSIPVIRHLGSKTPMDEIRISDENNWRKIHWKAIESAYSSAPFFDYYGIEVEEMIFRAENNLVKFNNYITTKVLSWLDIDMTLNYSTEYLNEEIVIDNRANNFTKFKQMKPYKQVFAKDKEFIPNLSILDLIFCEGPLARKWIVL
jgi:hypothetical protein